LCNVVFDEELGASERTIEEAGSGNVAQVSEEARSYEIDKREDVAILSRDSYGLETLVDEAVVEVLGGGVLAPGRVS
jgi:hypothetical protein